MPKLQLTDLAMIYGSDVRPPHKIDTRPRITVLNARDGADVVVLIKTIIRFAQSGVDLGMT